VLAGTKIKLTWAVVLHISLYVAAKRTPILRRHIPLHMACYDTAAKQSAESDAVVAFVAKMVLAAKHAFRAWHDQLDPSKHRRGDGGGAEGHKQQKQLTFGDVVEGFIDWRNTEQYEPYSKDNEWDYDQVGIVSA
jgi:hypothetical protein